MAKHDGNGNGSGSGSGVVIGVVMKVQLDGWKMGMNEVIMVGSRWDCVTIIIARFIK